MSDCELLGAWPTIRKGAPTTLLTEREYLVVFSDSNGPVLCGNSMTKFLLYLYSSKLYNVRDEGLLLFCK